MLNVFEMKKAKKARTGGDKVSKVEVDCRHCNLMTPAWRSLCIHCGRPLSEEARRRALSS